MTGPFSVKTVEAVGVCTRTLSGCSDANATLARADAATLGGLRAIGDRLAVRRRFHDAAIHRRYQPLDTPLTEIFAALESARLDVLGVRWLPGVAKNLLAHPGAEYDGLRWLAFGAVGGRPAPPGKRELAADVQAALPPRLFEELTGLAASLDDQDRFAAAAVTWARQAGACLPPPLAAPACLDRFPLPVRLVDGDEDFEGADRSTPSPRQGSTAGDDGSPAREGSASSGGGGTPGIDVAGNGYRAYTTAHDRVVNAAALADRNELVQLRAKLDVELASVRSLVARLAKRLLRVLMARQVRAWRFDLDEGVLDGSRLAALVASRGGARPFKQEGQSPFPSTIVSLLIDHSGSMRGRPMLIAALTVEIFARVLERCGVKCEILGFTTRDWDGGAPAREWADRGYPVNPGRLNALEHIVIKGADVPWRRARIALGLFLRDEMLKENIDGEAVAWAHQRLLARPETRRILVVVSDGTPMDEATMAANGHEYLERHLQAVVDDIQTRSPVQLAAIGIGHDVSLFYRNATRIARMEQLGPALTIKLMSLLSPERSGRSEMAPRSQPVRRAGRR